GYLPHFDAGGFTQSITDANFRKRVEYYLDQNYGGGSLRIPAIAEALQGTLLKWDSKRYHLISWVIMPNHAHVLLDPFAGNSLSDIMHSIKSYTAHEANRILNRKCQFWAKEYFDRYIRD